MNKKAYSIIDLSARLQRADGCNMIKKLRGKKAGEQISQIFIWLILIISLLVFSVPFLFMISNSFETFSYVLPYPPKLFPTELNWDAYEYILSLKLFPTALINSIVNTTITVVISVFLSTLSAYGFSRIQFPGRETIFKLYLFTLMVPGFLNIIPQFVILRNITIFGENLIGSRTGLILIYVATNVCGHTFFLRNFFKSLPNSLSESVIVDGGGHGTIFFKIMLPLSKPAIGTMSIFAIQGFWEEYFSAKVLVGSNEKMITLPLLLQRLYGEHSTRWEWIFAASILALIPIIILFLVFQRKMVIGGMTQGSVKE
ncbi:MAG: carbohydrate ABC transporter permease [Clostridiales bacterium]|nr:carbohydrate ABC transporter permease [Clostridiales bacterium]